MDPSPLKTQEKNIDQANIVISDGIRYSVDKLTEMAKSLEPEEIPITELQGAIENECWEDLDSKKLKPQEVLKAIREGEDKYPKLKRHIDSIKNSNPQKPILVVMINGELVVFDGMHRLTKLFLEQKTSALVIKFESLPREAQI